MNYINEVITCNAYNELGFAIAKASQRAKQSGKLIRIYSFNALLWMTDTVIPEGTELIAYCYPGGRNLLYRRLRS